MRDLTTRLALLVTSSALLAGIACSTSGPDADPRTNGCITEGCFEGGVIKIDAGTNETFGDPLAGTTKVATLVRGALLFTEGPVWIGNRLLFSDVSANTIYELAADNSVTPFRTMTGGANGNAVDPQGRLVTCEAGRRRLVRTDAQLANPQPIAETFGTKPFNAPNDVVVRADGTIYFSDPFYGTPPPGGLPQDKMAVYRVAAAGGGPTRLAFDFNKPNGIALSPDGNTLYVVDNGAGNVLSAKLAVDGTLDGSFAKILDAEGGDGMAVDRAGNLYIAADAGILVFDGSGKGLGTIAVAPGTPTNCTFGGADMKTLFITSNNGSSDAATGLYSIRLNVPGLP